jgi:hypothetical protein
MACAISKESNPEDFILFYAFLHWKGIKVLMESMPDLGMRPKSKTCFGILTMPKNHQSYAHFSENLNFYMHNRNLWDLNDND